MPRHAKRLNSLLIKPAGPDCNLGCTYCFYLEKHALFPGASKHRMNPEVLEETVRQVMRQGGGELAFAWQGGEPTLMGVDFFRQAVELQKKHGRRGQTVGNGLQTNGVLIDEAWCRFLRDARFLVGLSLDGPAHVHDRYRRYRGGQPTWTRVTEALKRMLDHGVAVNGLVVVNDYSARFPREIYAFLKENGLTFMQFIPCLEQDPGDPTQPAPFSVSPEQLGRFLREVFDCWLDDFQDGRPTTQVRWFDSVFATYVGCQPPECTLLAECGTYVVVEHNGDVFACDFFVEDEWRLGNVLEGRLEDMLNSPLQARFRRRKAALPEECQACPWLVHCRGGCPKERWGTPGEPCRSRLCEGYQMFFSHADDRLRQLAGAWLAEQNPPSAIMAAAAREGPAPARVRRNAPCPCGSGAKYKHCCGKRSDNSNSE
jgi:uncharacterized protein